MQQVAKAPGRLRLYGMGWGATGVRSRERQMQPLGDVAPIDPFGRLAYGERHGNFRQNMHVASHDSPDRGYAILYGRGKERKVAESSVR